jgi:hypothetical protein
MHLRSRGSLRQTVTATATFVSTASKASSGPESWMLPFGGKCHNVEKFFP